MLAVEKRKTKKIKSLFNNENYKMYISLVRESGLPYKIIRSNYTLQIESSFLNIYFMQNVMNNKAFIVGALIAKDLKNSGVEMPQIDRSELKYFNFNLGNIIHQESDIIYNIDIKSAYANALNNNRLLEKKTFDFLCGLSKKDRLAAVGMLAARKDEFYYSENDNCVHHQKLIKETENWFYFCVLEIQKLMQEIQEKIGDDFLFYWVDGIFFKSKENKEVIENIIKNKGYNCSFEECFDFRYFENSTSKFLSYSKKEDEETVNKTLNLPKENRDVDKYLFKLLDLIKK